MSLKGSGKPGTRRRGTELEDAILDAAWDVLVEQGYPHFTYEAVAARAGTSRPVLYRRWPQREEMLLATLRKHWWSRPIPVPDTGNLRDDAVQFLRHAADTRFELFTLLSVQLMDYLRESGSSFAELRETLRPQGQPNALEQMVARAAQRGEVPDVPRPPRMISLPFDLFRHELLMTMKPVPVETIAEIVEGLWLPMLGYRGRPSPPAEEAPAGGGTPAR
ncbi:TetR family transcriptional regulator [Actinoplanes cyaneus]|uniref:TetR family transcriptional regulator n=1 Tax=Actinoplanes cyaneus TaxID=52696 RepID=A0A919MBW3_9ACTN|nr:TetR/AcrR family transcriptional regulator [Actinoplanes cyaneus]MCW2140196.1 transcriptional regulator, TetR family [Actinoplanes cyaneus]GID65511.1 TetR family transcriptional regulator [Actinoplanes cyaneus]